MKTKTMAIGVLSIVILFAGIACFAFNKDQQTKINALEEQRKELAEYDGKLAIYDESILGVEKDGRLKICNSNKKNDGSPYKEMEGWKDIEKIASFGYDVLGITKDKKVHMYEDEKSKMKQKAETWSNIKEVEESEIGVVGLDYDGNVHLASNEYYTKSMKEQGNSNMGVSKYNDWKDITHISVSSGGVAGVTKSGQIRLNTEKDGFYEYKSWSNIVSADFYYGTLVVLQKDGTVMVETSEQDREEIINKVHRWTDVVDVQVSGTSEDCMTIMALKADGTVAAVGEMAGKVSSLQGIRAFKLENGNAVFLMKDGTVKHIS